MKDKGVKVIYLVVPWLDESNCDCFKFNSLEQALLYIKEEGIKDFCISTGVVCKKEEDYQLIPDEKETGTPLSQEDFDKAMTGLRMLGEFSEYQLEAFKKKWSL